MIPSTIPEIAAAELAEPNLALQAYYKFITHRFFVIAPLHDSP
jgi:hypothetical protein